MNEISKAQLRQWYLSEKRTTYEIADMLGCSPTKAQGLLRKHGIELRGPLEAHSKEPETRTCPGCGKTFQVGGRGRPKKTQRFCSNHCRMLVENVSPSGHSSHAPRPKKNKDTLHNAEWLRQKYEVEKLSSTDIGNLLGCSRQTVKWALRKYGIVSRSIPEARKVLFDRQGRKNVTQQELIDAYGGKCVCCGERDPMFLTLDHIGGGGAKHRKMLGGNHVRKLRRELKATGWPKDKYRLLCMDCNHATRHGKPCPHQLLRDQGLTRVVLTLTAAELTALASLAAILPQCPETLATKIQAVTLSG